MHILRFHLEAAAVEATAVAPAIAASPPKSYLDPDQPVGPQVSHGFFVRVLVRWIRIRL